MMHGMKGKWLYARFERLVSSSNDDLARTFRLMTIAMAVVTRIISTAHDIFVHKTLIK